MKLLQKWKNGNATVTLYSDGTRETEWPDGEDLQLEYPLNIDIRVSTYCAFGANKNGVAVCHFCHESARIDGKECDYKKLLRVLKGLPAGIELAIGMNHYTTDLEMFLMQCKNKGWIVNLTVNQGLLRGFENHLARMVANELVYGVGISYRKGARKIPDWLLENERSVVHVIETIDNFYDVLMLSENGVKKILILGEKDFGFNLNRVDANSQERAKWFTYLPMLMKQFKTVSFDNLGLERLKPQRFIPKEVFQEIYQGEHSFYINAVAQTFSDSSRSDHVEPYQDIKKFFKARSSRP